MTPPKKLRLLGQTFTVEVVSDQHEAMFETNVDLKTRGTALVPKQRIYVADDLGKDQERETVVHEVLHCLIELVNLVPKEGEEERLVVVLAPLLLDSIRRNPKLVAYLMAP